MSRRYFLPNPADADAALGSRTDPLGAARRVAVGSERGGGRLGDGAGGQRQASDEASQIEDHIYPERLVAADSDNTEKLR